jgi:choline dehydrogenase-like flavoprotein
MNNERHYDVIIIGTGAGGGTLARKLAPTGKRILLLERGDYVPREKDNWSTRAVNVDGKYQTKDVWLDRDGNQLHPHTNYCVGGNTKSYGAALFRLRREDFCTIKHHGGISPAWPIQYDELEPYYTQAEHAYHVHGERGEDPTDPPASGPYPHPAVSHEPRMQQLAEDFAAAGLRPFHTPIGVMLDEKNPHSSKCIRCNTCDGFPCLVYAKSDAQVLGVDPALVYPNVGLMTSAYVERLETGASGREVAGVGVRQNGSVATYSADIVVVSCGAINSAALLLRSANDKHPRGLANGSEPCSASRSRASVSLGRKPRRGFLHPLFRPSHELRRHVSVRLRPRDPRQNSEDLRVAGFLLLASAWNLLYSAQREHRLATSRPYARSAIRSTSASP